MAIRALEHANHTLAPIMRSRVDALATSTAPSLAGWTKLSDPTQPIEFAAAKATIAFNSNGAIKLLEDGHTGLTWANSSHVLAQFVYQTLNDTDWDPFLYASFTKLNAHIASRYDYINGHGKPGGFCKPNSNNFTESGNFLGDIQGTYVNTDKTEVIVDVAMPARPVQKYGSPAKV